MSRRPLKILFSGMIAADPHQGGATWAILQYLLGLQRLGHEIWFVEPVLPEKWQPPGVPPDQTTNATYFHEVMSQFDLARRSALLRVGTHQTVGAPYPVLADAAATADLLINVSGMLTDPVLVERIPIRLYLDLDPAFVELWQVSGQADMRLAGHTHFATVGLALGRDGCAIATCGVDWIHTLPPVVLEHWPPAAQVPRHAITTIANWRSYGSLHHDGVFYGQKAHSFRRLMELPRGTREHFQIALSIHPDETADLDALRDNGWELVNPTDVAGGPATYREFIAGSYAEIAIAKDGYVKSNCGWFSDRSACYLASGRPVIAQDTGFARYLPTGDGLLAFRDVDGAAECVQRLRRDYAQHATAARRLAREFFDSDKVLARLLDQVGVA
jgi:hypothetical protein